MPAEPTEEGPVVHFGRICYRSTGLGVWGMMLRFGGMPLEKLALYMNSSQVSGNQMQQLRQAVRLTMAEGPFGPFRVVGRASMIAWFLQYSVMGFVFQLLDHSLSSGLGVRRVYYGAELMEPKSDGSPELQGSDLAKYAAKAAVLPVMAGSIESIAANRAEVQRYYGIEKFAKIEKALGSGFARKVCGPAFRANAARNATMSMTSFVVAPTIYKFLCPQEHKSPQSLFWTSLGINIFFGNVIAITQQALWGRSLDYIAVDGGRRVNYPAVVRDGLKAEGVAAFFTPAKWFSRVLMNAPAQGTLPWFYNSVLPRGEGHVDRVCRQLDRMISPSTHEAAAPQRAASSGQLGLARLNSAGKFVSKLKPTTSGAGFNVNNRDDE